MLFRVNIHRKSVLFPSLENYIVESQSGEVAATFALKKAKAEFPKERGHFVAVVQPIEGKFIGKAKTTIGNKKKIK